MPRSTTRPSIWWNTGMCVASAVSLRNTRPGMTDVDRRRLRSITRICTGDVWVRSTTLPGLAELDVERVLHVARRMAGRDVERLKLYQSALDLGALGDGEAEADEHVLEALAGLGDEVQVAARRGRRGTSVRSSRSLASRSLRTSISIAAAALRSASRRLERSPR